MLDFFKLFGAVGNVLPLLAVIAILMFWHLARKDPWDFEPKLYAGMGAESVLWGIPFVVIGMAVSRQGPHPVMAPATTAATAAAVNLWSNTVLSVGAGVYEELLFRLIAINLLSIMIIDFFELRPSTGIPLIIFASAALFSAYHLLVEPFDAGVFVFRAAIGVYLAGIYIYRGFGIAVGAHAVYDLFVTVLLPWLHR
jgi:membrane protease YdiL (CAAX protease family)